MQRIGYDADTERYTFRSTDGTLYESAPGSRYGELTRVGHDPEQTPEWAPEDFQQRRPVVEKGDREAVRMMLPFALLVLAFLLVMFKVLNGGLGGWWQSAADGHDSQVVHCAQGSLQFQVEKGDTCWAVAERYSLGVDDLLAMDGNEKVECERLRIGQGICVPA
jgi:hypothetical protein